MFRYNFGNGRYNVTAHGDGGHVTIHSTADVQVASGMVRALNASLVPFIARPIGELLGDPGYLPRNVAQENGRNYGGTEPEAA